MINRIFEPKETPKKESPSTAAAPSAEPAGGDNWLPTITEFAGQNPAAVVAIGLIATTAAGF